MMSVPKISHLRGLLLAIAVSALPFTGPAFAKPAQDVISAVKTAIVRIEISGIHAANSAKKSASGTGFIVSPDGFVLTNYHLMQELAGVDIDTIKFSVFSGNGAPVKALPVNGSEASDLLLLKIPERDAQYPTVALGSALELQIGASLSTIGYPKPDDPQFQLDPQFRDGTLSAREGPSGSLWTVSIPFSPGISGSPVFTDDGKVVGVARAVSPQDGESRYMIPIHFADTILTHLKVAKLQQDLDRVLKALGGAETAEETLQDRLTSAESSIGELRMVYEWRAVVAGDDLRIEFSKLVGGGPTLRGIEPYVRPIAVFKPDEQPVQMGKFRLDSAGPEFPVTYDNDRKASGFVLIRDIKDHIRLRVENTDEVESIPELFVRVAPVLDDGTPAGAKMPPRELIVRVSPEN